MSLFADRYARRVGVAAARQDKSDCDEPLGSAPSRVRPVRLALLLLLASCAYDPPLAGDHAAPKYQSDLSKCRRQAEIAAERIAGQTPFTEIKSAFTSSEPQRQDVRSCMTGKGYVVAK